MATIPTVPTFVANDTSITKLQQLSYCASFLSVGTVTPMWHFHHSAQQGPLTASTWTPVVYDTNDLDSDGVWTTNGKVTFVTQGYYATEAAVQAECTATTFFLEASFWWYAGANNPNYVAGTQKIYGAQGTASYAATGADACVCINEICPVVCYPGDYVNVYVWANQAVTLNNNTPSGAVQGRFVPNFTGMFIRTGS